MEKINQYIEHLNEYFTEEKQFDSFYEEVGIRVACRFVVEGIVRKLFNKKPLAHFDGSHNMISFYNLNKNLHDKYVGENTSFEEIKKLYFDLTEPLKAHEDFEKYFKKIEVNLIIEEDDISFIKEDAEPSKYKFIVLGSVESFRDRNYDLYEVAKYSRGYDQISTKMILVQKGIKLYRHHSYDCELFKAIMQYPDVSNVDQECNNISKKGLYFFAEEISIVSDFNIINLNELNKKILNVANEFYSVFDIPLLSYLTAKLNNDILLEDKYFLKLKEIYEQEGETEMKPIMDSLLFLKYRHKDKFKVLNNPYNPMQFEFWTKNPSKASFNFCELELFEVIFSFIDPLFLKNRNFHAKENRIIYDKLQIDGKYELYSPELNFKEIEDQEYFYSQYDEYKLVQKNSDYYRMKYFQTIEEWFESKINEDALLDTKQKISDGKKLNKICNSSFTLITGPPGSGKTQLIRESIKIFNENNEKTIFLGPTWRSAMVFDDRIYGDRSTVQNYFGKRVYEEKFDELTSKYKNLIIDEISMLSDTEWYLISCWVKDQFKRVIISGDLNQLPPIHSVGILKHIDLMGTNHISLNETSRQSGNLRRVVEEFLENGKLSDGYLIREIVKTYDTSSNLYAELKKFGDYKIITPINYGPYGRKVLNQIMTSNTNNELFVGDSVSIDETATDEQLKRIVFKTAELKIKNIKEGQVVFDKKMKYREYRNYDLDTVNSWGWENEGNLTFFFDERVGLRNAYVPFSLNKSITSHYSQGSTIEKVVYIVPKNVTVSKENIYTAISRASGSELENLKIFVHKNDYNKICM